MRSEKIRFAVIGCGHIGMRHAAFITSSDACELTALCDPRPAAELAIADYNVPFFQEEDELMRQDFDVLCIATPNGLHERHALKALDNGHHVLIEKPMALTAAACTAIINKAAHLGKHIFSVMQNRYAAPSAWLKKLLEEGKLGKIFLVTIHCLWNRDHRYYRKGDWKGTLDLDGGVLFTQFSHFIDTLHWLFGDIEDISASMKNFSHGNMTAFDDSGIVNFQLKQGGMGSMLFTTAAWQANVESSLTIIAEKGAVKISGQYMDEVVLCRIEDYDPPSWIGSTPKAPASNHSYIFDNVVAVLKEGARPDIDPREACKVVQTIEKIYKTTI
jgi:UDP-N-acetyl-2-amino-2-deoxyglucuronate dehydrogenase